MRYTISNHVDSFNHGPEVPLAVKTKYANHE